MTRKGAFTVWTECWDLEIFDFIDLRKTSGEERRRARDLFLGISYNDLFFQRESIDGEWILFDPKDAPLLSESYGDTFKTHYENYEKQYKEDPSKFNPNTKVVKARDVLKYHIKSWSDVGMPFFMFKDTVNEAHKNKHTGLIRSSNLCVTGDTNILTKEYGNTPIGLLVNKGIEHATCWNGNAWSYTKLFKTSDDQKVVTVEFTNGKKIKATPYHRWSVISEYEEIKIIETKELRPGDTMEGYRIPNEVNDPYINDEPNTVKTIIDNGESEPTYCGTEPLNSTLIFNGVLTMNCSEVLSTTSDKYTAVCNLGSINLARVNEDKDIKRVVKLANRIMDNCIDLTNYPSAKAKKFQEDFRSCGLGSLGIAEMLANKKIHFGSDEHIKLIDYIWKLISDTIYASSTNLAKEKGGCNVNPEIRNAYRMCIAPNSSSAILAGTTNGLEPVYNKIWVEENKRGAYVMTAPHLNIENYEYYKNAYEIDIYRQIDAAAAMQQHIDMGMSFNVFLEPDGLTIKSVRDIIVYAWKKKLKTLYYMRSKPPKNKEVNDNKIVCVGCVN